MGDPQRIVCLTAETTEIAFAVGAGPQVVGVSGFAERPPEARRLPRVSAFSTADVDAIEALRPDLVLAFSDLQADIVASLVRRGLTVLALNQRTLAQTAEAIRILARAVGRAEQGEALATEFTSAITEARERAAGRRRRPRVYFEEWDSPLISGIGWVGELIEVAGGEDIFPELRDRARAPDRVVDPDDVRRRDPEIIVASWCGKKFDRGRLESRPQWSDITAVRTGRVYELPAVDVLQPGPSLLHGLAALERIIGGAAT